MTEPPVDETQQTVDDVVVLLEKFSITLRGVVVMTIDHAGVARISMGGAVRISEVRLMIRTLETLVVNSGRINELMGMEAKGSA